jgi:hypothetical protein
VTITNMQSAATLKVCKWSRTPALQGAQFSFNRRNDRDDHYLLARKGGYGAGCTRLRESKNHYGNSGESCQPG